MRAFAKPARRVPFSFRESDPGQAGEPEGHAGNCEGPPRWRVGLAESLACMFFLRRKALLGHASESGSIVPAIGENTLISLVIIRKNRCGSRLLFHWPPQSWQTGAAVTVARRSVISLRLDLLRQIDPSDLRSRTRCILRLVASGSSTAHHKLLPRRSLAEDPRGYQLPPALVPVGILL
jgi:hypothetical protein